MDLSDPSTRSAWWARLGAPVSGRGVVLGVAPAAAFTRTAAALRAGGAADLMLLAAGAGAGPGPTAEDGVVVPVPSPHYPSMTAAVRDEDRLARSLPPEVREALDAWDPDRQALWWGSPFVRRTPIDGRRVIGGRPDAWQALEDKTTTDTLWHEVGYHAAPYAVVDAGDPGALAAAARRLDRGDGVVCAGDARDGINGGGDFVRWVAGDGELGRATSFFRGRCDRVRVQPFLEGVPCSIHGMVLPDGTAVFRPVELAILRGAGPDGRRFVFGGQGTSWDPPEDDRHRMRGLVRDVGALLAERVGYRGGFGIDGVLTTDGFRPTELNPRFSGGLAVLTSIVDPVGFLLLQVALVEGADPGVGARELEDWALPAMDAGRTMSAKAVSETLLGDPTDLAVRWDGHVLRPDPAGELTVSLGPTGAGTFARVSADGVLTVGDRLGPLNAALVRLLDERFGAGFGPVEAAPDVRAARQ